MSAVRWDVDRPDLSWTIDLMHNPKPYPPIMHDFRLRAADGTNRAHRWFGQRTQIAYQLINGYAYGAGIIGEPEPPQRTEEDAIRTLEQDWRASYLPELIAINEEMVRFPPRDADGATWRTHLQQSLDQSVRMWEIHFLVTPPAHMAIEKAMDLYRALWPGAADVDAIVITQGYGNITTAAEIALWDAGQELAASSPTLAQAVADIQARYGAMGADQGDFFSTTWGEDAGKLLRDVAARVERPDPRARLAQQIAARDAALRALRGAVSSEQWARFSQWQDWARVGIIIGEDHAFYIDRSWIWNVRRLCRACGEWLADRGRVDDAADAPFLRLNELFTLLNGPVNLREALRDRRSAFSTQQRLTPPPVLGVTHPPARAGMLSDRFWGPTTADASGDILRGAGASPGVVRGRAVIVSSLEEAGRLRPGDVLVCATTNASWVPLFDTAAAIVTDTGGVLSHAAVVAREFGLPAVVGTKTATQRIRDGQMVEVNGSTGEVRQL